MDYSWHLKHWDELSTSELYEVIALRIRVFIIEQNCPYQDADGKDMKSYHLFATDSDGRCVAYLRLVQPGVSYDEWSIGRVATDLSVRQTGLGKVMMGKAVAWLKDQHNNPAVRISAQTYLLRFYEGFGFQRTGKAYMEDNIPHEEMVKGE